MPSGLYYLAVARQRIVEISGWVVARWRTSLQLRVVALTLAITSAVVAVIGYVLVTQIREQVLSAKQRAAIEQSSEGVSYVVGQLDLASGVTAPAVSETLESAVNQLQQRATAAGLFYVISVLRDADGAVVRPITAEPTLSVQDLPADLQAVVGEDQQALSYATMDVANSSQQVLVVGSAVPTNRGDIELYYIYPLDSESAVMDFVGRTVVAAALAFLLLIPGVGLLISRLVVLPVREAARTAQRLAAGELDQRMAVRGADDLARLATSFNGMAASLSAQISRLERMSQVQQRFSSDVSHELRTPLTTVRMAAEMLYDYRDEFPEVASRSAELLNTELDRFEELLKDLLEISRYDAGGLRLDAQSEDVRALIDRVVTPFRPLADDQGCELTVDIDDEVATAEISVGRVERVLRNLIANALEHGVGQPVEVTASQDDFAVAIAVRDHGVGIDQNAADRLFDRFWRADPSRVRKLGGTGLGMAISLEDVRLHGGWLHVWGAPEAGTCFRMTLPVNEGGVILHSPLPLIPPDVEDPTEGVVGGEPPLRRTPADEETDQLSEDER